VLRALDNIHATTSPLIARTPPRDLWAAVSRMHCV